MMNPDLYQRLAARTECDQDKALYRMADGGKDEAHLENGNTVPIRVNHAVIGLMGEVGELAAAVEKWVYYGSKLDVTNVKEEAGDCLWYLAQLLNSLGFSMADVMEANILKLKTRYPEKFSTWESANRDLEAERKALEKVYPPGLPAYDPAQEEDNRQRADYEAKKARCQADNDHDSHGGEDFVYDHKVIRHDTGPTNPGTDEVTQTPQKVTDAVVTSASRGYPSTLYAGLGRDWSCPCGKINPSYDNECGSCSRVRLLVINEEAKETLPAQSHSTHEWDSDKVNASCRKCGAYKHLGSGFMTCRSTARVDDQPRTQNGHGWAEPDVIDGEY
jgi:NTP pyrophosphatase (non-canonical NTP hydrolase)